MEGTIIAPPPIPNKPERTPTVNEIINAGITEMLYSYVLPSISNVRRLFPWCNGYVTRFRRRKNNKEITIINRPKYKVNCSTSTDVLIHDPAIPPGILPVKNNHPVL